MSLIKIFVDGVEVRYEKVSFSDGSSNIKIEPCEPRKNVSVTISPRMNCDEVLWELMLVVSALESISGSDIQFILNLPYLPHARADRVFESGNAYPLKMFVDAVFDLFDIVVLTDPHSDQWKEFADAKNVYVKPQTACYMEVVPIELQHDVVLVAPDAGALKKAEHLQRTLTNCLRGNVELITASKRRCVSTGKILATEIENHDLTGKRCVIVDDIADGGGTFLGLASMLRKMNPESVSLYVTHGIFSKGLEPFKGLVDNIFIYQSVGYYITKFDIELFNKGEL